MEMKKKPYAIGYHASTPNGNQWLETFTEARFDTIEEAYDYARKQGCGPDYEPLCILEYAEAESRAWNANFYNVLDEHLFTEGLEIVYA